MSYLSEKFHYVLTEPRLILLETVDGFLDMQGQIDHHVLLDDIESSIDDNNSSTVADRITTVYLTKLSQILSIYGIRYNGMDLEQAWMLTDTMMELENLIGSEDVEGMDSQLEIIEYWLSLQYPHFDHSWIYEAIAGTDWLLLDRMIEILSEQASASEEMDMQVPALKARLGSYDEFEGTLAQVAISKIGVFQDYGDLPVPHDDIAKYLPGKAAKELVGWCVLSTLSNSEFPSIAEQFLDSYEKEMSYRMSFMATFNQLIASLEVYDASAPDLY